MNRNTINSDNLKENQLNDSALDNISGGRSFIKPTNAAAAGDDAEGMKPSVTIGPVSGTEPAGNDDRNPSPIEKMSPTNMRKAKFSTTKTFNF